MVERFALRKTNEKMTEKEIETEIGKETLLQSKIDQYADMLFRLSLLRLQNVQDAEDVVQEVFYQYIKREEPFESSEHEKAWMIRVTLNACKKLRRSAWNRHQVQNEDPLAGEIFSLKAEGAVRQGEHDALEDTTLTLVLRAEENRTLLQAVCKLPPRYRDVIHLFYYEELSIKEIAKITGRGSSTVTSWLTRGRELLRKLLKEEYDFA